MCRFESCIVVLEVASTSSSSSSSSNTTSNYYKVSDTPKGEEIIGILTHLTDTSQNSAFHDKYFCHPSY